MSIWSAAATTLPCGSASCRFGSDRAPDRAGAQGVRWRARPISPPRGTPQRPRRSRPPRRPVYGNEQWRFRVGDRWETVRGRPRLARQQWRHAARRGRAGLGICILPSFIAAPGDRGRQRWADPARFSARGRRAPRGDAAGPGASPPGSAPWSISWPPASAPSRAGIRAGWKRRARIGKAASIYSLERPDTWPIRPLTISRSIQRARISTPRY